MTASSCSMQFSISEVNKLTSVCSPEILLFGIPWQIEISKRENGTKKSLGVYLKCANKDKSPNWTATACATIKLLPFRDNQRPVECYIPPYVYHRFVHNSGKDALIEWDDLLTKDKLCVDTIRFEVNIVAENPNDLHRSISNFKDLDFGHQGIKLQLIVQNITNLWAVRSPEISLFGVSWRILVYKHVQHLGIILEPNERSKNESTKVTIAVNVVSSKDGLDSIEKSCTKMVQWPEALKIRNIVCWDEMMKPKNEFVNGNSITLKIELKSDKEVGGDATNVNRNNVTAKRRRIECSICLEDLDSQDMSTTPCGHSYCTVCITAAIRGNRVCPLCNAAVQLNDLRPLFLSA